MVRFSVVVQVPGLDALRASTASLFGGSVQGEILVNRWGLRLRSYWQERFAKLSRGGGEWPPLAKSTIKEKERVGSRTPTSILRRFGPMFHSLDAVYSGQPGQLQELLPNGAEYGIGGPWEYPEGVTMGQVAAWHHEGAGNLPTRRVIDLPSSDLVRQMTEDVLAVLRPRR